MLADQDHGALKEGSSQLAAVEQQLPPQKFALAWNRHSLISSKFLTFAIGASKFSVFSKNPVAARFNCVVSGRRKLARYAAFFRSSQRSTTAAHSVCGQFQLLGLPGCEVLNLHPGGSDVFAANGHIRSPEF